MNILDDVKRILAQPFECRKTSLPDGALHNVQKELENMINAIDKDIYSFTPSYGKYLIDCWLGDELVDKLLWGIERSGFFNGREKWAKGFENQRV